MTDDIVRTLYHPMPGPDRARRTVERLAREFGEAFVREHAKRTRRDLGMPATAHEDRPLIYLDALCRVVSAQAERAAPRLDAVIWTAER